MPRPPADWKSAHHAIQRILVEDWDPIGVMDDPDWPRDEYDAYVGEIYGFLQRGESAAFISRHLCFLEEKVIGLGAPSESARLPVANKLKALFESSSPSK